MPLEAESPDRHRLLGLQSQHHQSYINNFPAALQEQVLPESDHWAGVGRKQRHLPN